MNVILGLILAVMLAASPLQQLFVLASQTKEKLSVSIKDLRNAPTTVVVNNRSLQLSTYAWQDFMPGAWRQGGTPVMVALKVTSADKQPLPSGIRLDRVWILFGEQVWEGSLRGRKIGEDKYLPINCPASPVCEISVHGPKWGTVSNVDVALRLIDSEGQEYLLQAPNQRVVPVS